jgi:hypothetical protein
MIRALRADVTLGTLTEILLEDLDPVPCRGPYVVRGDVVNHKMIDSRDSVGQAANLVITRCDRADLPLAANPEAATQIFVGSDASGIAHHGIASTGVRASGAFREIPQSDRLFHFALASSASTSRASHRVVVVSSRRHDIAHRVIAARTNNATRQCWSERSEDAITS